MPNRHQYRHTRCIYPCELYHRHNRGFAARCGIHTGLHHCVHMSVCEGAHHRRVQPRVPKAHSSGERVVTNESVQIHCPLTRSDYSLGSVPSRHSAGGHSLSPDPCTILAATLIAISLSCSPSVQTLGSHDPIRQRHSFRVRRHSASGKLPSGSSSGR